MRTTLIVAALLMLVPGCRNNAPVAVENTSSEEVQHPPQLYSGQLGTAQLSVSADLTSATIETSLMSGGPIAVVATYAVEATSDLLVLTPLDVAFVPGGGAGHDQYHAVRKFRVVARAADSLTVEDEHGKQAVLYAAASD